METIICPICSGHRHTQLFMGRDFRLGMSSILFPVVRCEQCAFVFLNPRPSQNESPLFYPRAFYHVKDSFPYKLFGVCFRWVQALNNRVFIREKNRGRLLDIGCGTGDFLLSMQREGYDVYGVEVSEHSKNIIPATVQGKIYGKNVEECHFPEGFFDTITMAQSLEHIHNLNALLQEIKRILKPGGTLYVSIPNFNFCEYRILGPYAYTLDVPRHLYFFTRQSLSKLLDKHGFTRRHFLRNFFCDLFITPASFYHGVWYYVQDAFSLKNRIFKVISFLPLVIIGMIMHVIFISQGHVLQVTCEKPSA